MMTPHQAQIVTTGERGSGETERVLWLMGGKKANLLALVSSLASANGLLTIWYLGLILTDRTEL